MNSFKKNVIESFKKVREDMLRMQHKIDSLERENKELLKRMAELSEKLAVFDIKLKVLKK